MTRHTNTQLDTRIVMLEAIQNDTAARVRDVETDVAAVKATIEKRGTRASEIMAKIDTAVANSKERSNKLEARIEAHAANLSERIDVVHEGYVKTYENITATLNTRVSDINRHIREQDEIRDSVSDHVLDLAGRLDKLVERFEEHIKLPVNHEARILSTSEEWDAINAGMRERVTGNLDHEIRVQRDIISAYESKHGDYKRDLIAKDKYIANLQLTNNVVDAEKRELLKQVEELQLEINRSAIAERADREEQRRHRSNLEAELAAMGDTLRAVRAQRDRLLASYDSAVDELLTEREKVKERDGIIDGMRKDLDGCVEDLARARGDLKARDAVEEMLDAQIDELKQQRDALDLKVNNGVLSWKNVSDEDHE